MKKAMYTGMKEIYGKEYTNLQPVAFDYVPARNRRKLVDLLTHLVNG